ncbi:MAG TPA: hypothetical protein VEK80_07480 [Kribbellaceae bacterium]|nr:hypothetical protein [Kribbellaceae bacterium]
MKPQTFELVRYEDVSGVSGTGTVAEGCRFSDGSVALRWRGPNASTAIWPDIDAVIAVHGHCGATVVRWIDQPELEAVPDDVSHLLATGIHAATQLVQHRPMVAGV